MVVAADPNIVMSDQTLVLKVTSTDISNWTKLWLQARYSDCVSLLQIDVAIAKSANRSITLPMADFNTHIFSAAALASLSATACTKLLNLDITDGLTLTVSGIVGGILPDIDLKYSQPSRALFTGLGVITALAWLFAHVDSYTALELWLIAIAVFSLVRYPLWWSFHVIAKHRGLMHSITAALLFGVMMCATAWQWLGTLPLQSWLLGIFMTAGYLLHLALDELYSVDFMGVRIKRSFGSALKILDRDQYLLSLALLCMLMFTWFFSAPIDEAWQDWESSLAALEGDWRAALLPESWLASNN